MLSMGADMDLVFKALAAPERRLLLDRLRASNGQTLGELSAHLEMTRQAVSKHLKVLERAGLISRSRDAQWRPCKLEAKPLQQAADWVEQYRKFWEESIDRLEDYLSELQAREKQKEKDKGIRGADDDKSKS